MYSSHGQPTYWDPPPSAPLFLSSSDPSDPFGSSFDAAAGYFPPGSERAPSLPFPSSSFSVSFPTDLPPLDVEAALFQQSEAEAEAEAEVESDGFPAPPLSPSSAFESDGSGSTTASSTSSGSSGSSHAHALPPPLLTRTAAQHEQYGTTMDESPFQLSVRSSSRGHSHSHSHSHSHDKQSMGRAGPSGGSLLEPATGTGTTGTSAAAGGDELSAPPTLSAALLASLSFDPSSLLAQLSVSLSSPAPVEPKKRNRIPGLTAAQRAALKRQKHREIDTQRRHREQAAISKLHTLVYQPLQQGKERKPTAATAETSTNDGSGSGGGGRAAKRVKGEWLDEAGHVTAGQQQAADDEPREERDEDDNESGERDNENEEGEAVEEDDSTKKDKVTILEHSARRLEQMQSIIHQLTAACNTQQQTNRHLLTQLQTSNRELQQSPPPSHPLAWFRAPVSQQLDANLGQQSLYSSLFLSASAPIFVIRCDTGYVVDVNSRMLDESGWMRHHLVGRLMSAPYDMLVGSSIVTLERKMRLAPNRVLVERGDGQWVPAQGQEQYAKSRFLAKQLYTGQVNQIDAVWRSEMRNGKVYEVTCKSWINGFRDVLDEEGNMVKRPNTIVMVCDTQNAVCVDGA